MLGPDRRKKLNLHDNDELFDPATNARAAKLIHKEQGKKAWSTFSHGTYKSHLTKARQAVADLGLGASTSSKSTSKARGSTSGSTSASTKAGTYIVQQHDNLSVIARRSLGAASLWLPLYEINLAVIGPDPGKLTPGTRLRLPVISTRFATATIFRRSRSGFCTRPANGTAFISSTRPRSALTRASSRLAERSRRPDFRLGLTGHGVGRSGSGL